MLGLKDGTARGRGDRFKEHYMIIRKCSLKYTVLGWGMDPWVRALAAKLEGLSSDP